MARTPASAAPGPVRTCIGCREQATRSELLRVVAGTDSRGRPAALPDPEAVAPGRGAHLHPTPGCYDRAVRRRAFTRALRSAVPLTGEPVGEHLASLLHPRTTNTDQDWSRSS